MSAIASRSASGSATSAGPVRSGSITLTYTGGCEISGQGICSDKIFAIKLGLPFTISAQGAISQTLPGGLFGGKYELCQDGSRGYAPALRELVL